MILNNIIEGSIEKSRAVLAVLLLVFFLGSSAYNSIPKESDPDIQIPIIYVSVKLEGVSPEDSERLIIKPLEKELKAIEGIKEISSYAAEGNGSIVMEFFAGYDIDKALDDVREKVDIAKSELPQDSDEPIIREVNLSLFPVLNLMLIADMPERGLLKIAKYLRDEIEELPNVLNVDIAGDREEALEVIIDPSKLQNYNLTISMVNQIAANNKLIAAGALKSEGGKYNIKVPGIIEDISDLLELPVKVNNDAVVKVRDITQVRKSFKDPEGFARVDGKNAVVLEVVKRTGTNIIETVEQVKEVVAREQRNFPDHLEIKYSQDKSTDIIDILTDLQNNIILAIILVMIVVLYFVGMRSAILVAISIPASFLLAILLLKYLGFTLNIVVLFSLILSVGMLVDSAIVITEMADKKISEGYDAKDAYPFAAKMMKWPIISSTATTLTVFMPLLFWPGLVGQFMKFMPITLIATLSSALVVAIIFLPTIGSILGNRKAGKIKYGSFTIGYKKILERILVYPKIFTAIILISLVATSYIYGKFGKGVEFFPDIEPESLIVQVKARGNISIYEKDRILKQVEDKIIDIESVKTFYSRSGKNESKGPGSEPEDVIGNIQLELENWKYRPKADLIIKDIKNRTKDIPGIMVDIVFEKGGPRDSKPVAIDVAGFGDIDKATALMVNQMKNIDGFINIEDSRPIAAIEWEFDIDREQAIKYGVDINTIGSFIKLVTNGLIITSYQPDDSDEEVDILLRLPKENRNLNNLDNIRIPTESGNIPISNFIERKTKRSSGLIKRVDGKKVITIQSDVDEGYNIDALLTSLKDSLKNVSVPNVKVNFKGEDEDQQETKDFLSAAFILALAGMAIILIMQFNNIFQTVIILSAVFLSTIGVLIALLITNQPFGIVMCGVGIISLAGIVVNNNIIFIDYYKLVRKNKSAKEALIETGAARLRPILLTAGTTILGLIPMVLKMNLNFLNVEINFDAPSSQWWVQLSTTIAGGLAFATILTLFFTPCLLMIQETRILKKTKRS